MTDFLSKIRDTAHDAKPKPEAHDPPREAHAAAKRVSQPAPAKAQDASPPKHKDQVDVDKGHGHEADFAHRFSWAGPDNHAEPGSRPGAAEKPEKPEKSQKPDEPPPPSVETARRLEDRLREEPSKSKEVLDQQGPEVDRMLNDLKGQPPEVVQETVKALSAAAQAGGGEASKDLADRLARTLPPDQAGLLAGLTNAGQDGNSALSSDLEKTYRDNNQGLTADQVRQANQTGHDLSDVRQRLNSSEGLQGGAQASGRLKEILKDAPPEVAREAINQLEKEGTLSALTDRLGSYTPSPDSPPSASLPRGAGSAQGRSESYEALQQILGDLSYATGRSGDPAQADRLAGQLAGKIPKDESTASLWTDALSKSVGNGDGAALSGALSARLARDQHPLAEKFTAATTRGLNQERENFTAKADRVDELNRELFYLDSQFGPLMSEQQRKDALEEFRRNHSEYAELDKMAGTLGSDLEVVDRTWPAVAEQSAAGDLKEAHAGMLAEVPRLGRTEQGKKLLGAAEVAQASGQHTWLERLDDEDVLKQGEELFKDKGGADGFKKSLQDVTVQAATAQSVDALARGDFSRAGQAFQGLKPLYSVFGMSEEGFNGAIDDLGKLALGAAHGDQAAMETILSKSSLPASFKVGGALLGAVGLGLNIGKLGDPDAKIDDKLNSLFQAAGFSGDLADAVGGVAGKLGEAGLAQGLATSQGLSTALGIGKLIGTSGNLLTAGLDLYHAVDSLGKGEYAEAGFYGASAVGGVLLAAGYTGPGAILVLGGAAGLYQYERVKASNIHENPDTEAFLRHGLEGVKNPQMTEVVNHLRDASSGGKNVGDVLQSAAGKLGLSPQEFFRYIGTLPPQAVAELVEAGHGIPEDGNQRRATDGSDSRVGQIVIRSENGKSYQANEKGEPMVGTNGQLIEVTGDLSTRRSVDVETGPLKKLPGVNAEVISPSSVAGWVNYLNYLSSSEGFPPPPQGSPG